jgi:hypothetical protein
MCIFTMEVSGLLEELNYFREQATAITDNTKKAGINNKASRAIGQYSGTNTGDQSLSVGGVASNEEIQQLLVQKITYDDNGFLVTAGAAAITADIAE